MNYFNPAKLVFGRLVRRKIAEECVGKSVLIICSSTAFHRNSLIKLITVRYGAPVD